VDPSVVGSGNTFTIFLGNDINTQQSPGNFVKTKETHFDTTFSTSNLQNGHDVGVVITSTAMNRPGLPINHTALTSGDLGSPLRIVGFGINSGTDTMGTSAGTKRQTNVTLDNVTSKFIQFGNASHDTCEGDSGGPAFLMQNGVEVIAGITSFGAQGCTQGATDTRVDTMAAGFVDPYIQMFDNGNTQPAPDMASSGPVDMAGGGGGGDGGGKPAPGTVGADCTDNNQCQSNLCAKDNGSGFCTTSCDPAKDNQCPSGLTCGEIDTGHYCVKQASGGCDFAGGGVPGGMLVLGLLLLVGFAARRRRA
jgi:MYXO-CTERM domain-containing protein